MQKLYAYVDESGQDTKGALFVVGVVVLETERESILKELEQIEEKSRKRVRKWNKAPYAYRKSYFDGVVRSHAFQNSLFFETFTDNKKYIEMTSYATAKAILKRVTDSNYTTTIFIDGFREREIEIFMQGLRDLHIRRRKIRGVRKEESNSFILLADALCGLVRDANDEDEWASAMLHKMKKEGILTAL